MLSRCDTMKSRSQSVESRRDESVDCVDSEGVSEETGSRGIGVSPVSPFPSCTD